MIALSEIAAKVFGSVIKDTTEGVGSLISNIKEAPGTMELQLKYKELIASLEEKAVDIQAQIDLKAADNVSAEIKGESWLQRNWRPVTILLFVFIVFNNYVLVPYLKAPTCTLDDNIWFMIKTGITGYGAERGLSKLGVNVGDIITATLKKK